jgi:hypothetical protein
VARSGGSSGRLHVLRQVSGHKVIFIIGPTIVDWNDGHMFNPKWRPHAFMPLTTVV